MPVLEIQCEQCGETLRTSSFAHLKRAMLSKKWEPFGIHVSVGVAAADRHDTYACSRCSIEMPHARVSRLLDNILSSMNVTCSYDIVGGALDTEVLFNESGVRVPVVLHRKDADVQNSMRTAIELTLAH